jgi:proliferating cell nuclear antigen
MSLLEIKTVQSGAIRVLFESLKDVLSDVNIHVTESYLKIVSMDGSKTAIVHLKLMASQFETFYCGEKSLSLGVNMMSLFKILKSIKNNDIVTFSVKAHDTTKLIITLANPDKFTKTVSVLKLLDIDDNLLNIPNVEFDSILSIPSSDFQNYIRDLSVISNEIVIESNDQALTLQVDGDFASQCITVSQQQSNGLTVTREAHTSNKFNLKYLLLFTKSSNLCNNVELYLKSNFPLVMIYNVANLGQLKFCLAPK